MSSTSWARCSPSRCGIPTVDASVLPPVLRRLHQLDAMFSTYRPDSVISRLNRNELRPAEAPADVRFVLEQCEQWRRRTGGRFDVRFAGALDPSGYVKGWAIAQASALLQEAGSTLAQRQRWRRHHGDRLCR